MPDAMEKIPPLVHLHYNKGELIMKEGDYGISIYKVLKGTVRVLKESGDKEVPLATLGAGEIFGEMTFLNKLLESRSASVRAVDDVELEAWHPARLTREYKKMPSVLKYVINQTMVRLNRMNTVVTQLTEKKRKEKETSPPKDEWADKRKYYRKDVELTCTYRPTSWSKKATSVCHVTDLSLGGVGMEVSSNNALNFDHNPDDEFEIGTRLPSGKELRFSAKVRSLGKSEKRGQLHVGLEFTDMKGETAKSLGFFLMP